MRVSECLSSSMRVRVCDADVTRQRSILIRANEFMYVGTPVSVHERIEELRLMVEESMGSERFQMAYNYVKQTRGWETGEGEEMQTERIAEVMGEGCEHLFPSLLQLIVCEQSVYCAAANR